MGNIGQVKFFIRQSISIHGISTTVRIVFILAFWVSTSVAIASDSYHLYVNERYGYSISYPVDFIPQGVPDAGDGQAFISATHDAQLLVFARSCTEGSGSPASDYVADYKQQQEVGILTVTYSRKSKNLVVVSGHKKGRIFYNKMLIDDVWCTEFNFEYDEAMSDKYNAITKHIALSFKS